MRNIADITTILSMKGWDHVQWSISTEADVWRSVDCIEKRPFLWPRIVLFSSHHFLCPRWRHDSSLIISQLQPSSSPGTNKRLVSQQKYFHPQSAWVRDISVRRCQFHWWIDTVGPASSGSVSISQRTSQYCEQHQHLLTSVLTNDHTIGWQNLNPLSHPNTTLAT